MTACVAGHQLIAPDVKLGRDGQIYGFVNLNGCEIGDETLLPKTSPTGATVAGNPARVISASSLMK
jgi:acetyltransferase-like isoleucine patch superfamily enzyme